MNKKLLTWIIGILFTASILSGGLLLSYAYSLRSSKNEFEDLAQIFQENQTKETVLKKNKLTSPIGKEDFSEEEIEEELDMTLVFKELHEKNNDIAGWLSIPGTKINYPVMHTPKNPEYYLYRNFEKKYSFSGVPFIDHKASVDPQSDNILIHGHHMNDGSMFAQLLAYQEKEFFDQHPTIEFYTFAEKQLYDIIAVFPAEVYNDKDFNLDYHNFITAKNKEEFEKYITRIKEYSLFDIELTADYGDYLITLSTCAYHTTHGRFVVVGRYRDGQT